MGQEIEHYHFRGRDFREFEARLEAETKLLQTWFAEDHFAAGHPVGGVELELWLIDADGRPAPANETFLDECADPRIVPELSRFNVEINSRPYELRGAALANMEAELDEVLAIARRVAAEAGLRIAAIGILPTVRNEDLVLENISARSRYRALNEQILRLRQGHPLLLDIRGREHHLRTAHHDVMLEAAATSLQVHMQVAPPLVARLYNAAALVSAPMTALAANAPYLFEKELWDETRIPLFEQAVAVHTQDKAPRRVTFGSGYADRGLMQFFRENREQYAVILPILYDEPQAALAHLRLHNGTIWRWNRPLVGIETAGRPSLRVEHRVAAAGPTIADVVANAAFFFGVAYDLALADLPPESQLNFTHAEQNFYRAAETGLAARVTWPGSAGQRMDALILHELLPRMTRGLVALGLDGGDIERFTGIVRKRVQRRRNGADWQRAFVEKHGSDMRTLVNEYLERAETGQPVGDWGML